MKKLQMYINGSWVNGRSNETMPVINPPNGHTLAEVTRGSETDINLAVQSARTAFESDEWQQFKPYERGKLIYSMADKIRENKDELDKLETLDVGKPLT